MINAIKEIKKYTTLTVGQFILGSGAFAAFLFSMAVLILLGGSLI